jgi:hypothetical protein
MKAQTAAQSMQGLRATAGPWNIQSLITAEQSMTRKHEDVEKREFCVGFPTTRRLLRCQNNNKSCVTYHV